MHSKKMKKTHLVRGAKWVFTWSSAKGSNFCTDKLFNIKNLALLSKFSQRYCKTKNEGFMCQLEKGLKHNKLHLQGRFELRYGRVYKSVLLKYFNDIGIHSNGLFLNVEKDEDKSKYYVEKLESRIAGPFNNEDLTPYAGKDVIYIKKNPRVWQQICFSIIKKKQCSRKINFIFDPCGDSGKTTWVKFCLLYAKLLNIKAEYFLLSDVSRVMAGVCKVKVLPDTIFFDLPRSIGKNQSYCDLFIAAEKFKDGLLESSYYANHKVKCIAPPNVFMTSNLKPGKFLNYISLNRWNIVEIFPFGNDTVYQHEVYKEDSEIKNRRIFKIEIINKEIIYFKI